jgi:outer membrane lipoprotein-sorting protein
LKTFTSIAPARVIASSDRPFSRSVSRCWLLAVMAVALSATAALAQNSGNPDLQQVLNQMDQAASHFHTTQADFVWDQYQKVVDETDTQKGRIYFRRSGNQVEMAADIAEPSKKYVVFSGSKVQMLEPNADQVTVYNVGKDRADFESAIVLGFGGSGRDLLKSFDVKYAGQETVDGIKTAKLELTPKSQKVRNTFQTILLWIDPQRGISVQQKFLDPSGDYRLAKYSNIEVNQKIPDSVFKIKTDSRTKFLSPQG